jgi:predicted nucleotidyltransferase component of viral defense system
MMNVSPEDAIHKSFLNRLLIEICDHPALSQTLAFKGCTCATMLGFLDRFSVDLDFDLIGKTSESGMRSEFQTIFDRLGLTIQKYFARGYMYQVRYPSLPEKRNSIKISLNSSVVRANRYKVQYFREIDRLLNSQTIETMFANKLVAVTDRYSIHQTIAGRDLYDIHHFFISGYSYLGPVIRERTEVEPQSYFAKLIKFIQLHVNQTVINEDLNMLLSNSQFQSIRKVLIPETLDFLAREMQHPQRMIS